MRIASLAAISLFASVSPSGCTGAESEDQRDDGCGELSSTGECVDETSGRYCDAGEAVSFECGIGTCFVQNPSFGVDCGASVGESCNDGVHFSRCNAPNTACRITSADSGTCEDGYPSCSAAEDALCDDNVYQNCAGIVDEDQVDGQLFLVDCTEFGATCVAGRGCIVDDGEPCDPFWTICDQTLCDDIARVCSADKGP